MSVEARHWFGPHGDSSKGAGHPVMFGKPQPTKHFEDFPDGGGYPQGFVPWVLGIMGADAGQVLHLCSGSVTSGICLDVREAVRPSVVADCRATPFPDASFDYILADPPYAEDYAENLYGTGASYPKPSEILVEAARLLRPGGKVGLLHFIVPLVRRPLRLVGVWGVTTGSGYAIRAWSLFQKQHVDTLTFDGFLRMAVEDSINATDKGRSVPDGDAG